MTLKETVNRRLKDINDIIDVCEIVKGKNPFKVRTGSPEYNYIMELLPHEVMDKVFACGEAVNATNNLLGEIPTPEIVHRLSMIFEGLGHKAPLSFKSITEICNLYKAPEDVESELISKCKEYKEQMKIHNDIIEFLKKDVCPIANDNAISLHYELNRRNWLNFDNDPHIPSGIITRDIENKCLDFPLTAEFPYLDEQGNHILTVKFLVHKQPQDGRAGELQIWRVLQTKKAWELIKGKNEIQLEEWWNDLTLEGQENYTINELKFDILLDRKYLWFEASPAFRTTLVEIAKMKDFKPRMQKVGTETCIWAERSAVAGKMAKKYEELAKEIDWNDPTQITEMIKNEYSSLEGLDGEILNAFPRQTLFSHGKIAYGGWVESGFDPMRMPETTITSVYEHIAQIDPKIISKNFIKIIEGIVDSKSYHWVISDKARMWLNKFKGIKRAMRAEDWAYIIKLGEGRFELNHFLEQKTIREMFLRDPENMEKYSEVFGFTEVQKATNELYDILQTDDIFQYLFKITEEYQSDRLGELFSESDDYGHWSNDILDKILEIMDIDIPDFYAEQVSEGNYEVIFEKGINESMLRTRGAKIYSHRKRDYVPISPIIILDSDWNWSEQEVSDDLLNGWNELDLVKNDIISQAQLDNLKEKYPNIDLMELATVLYKEDFGEYTTFEGTIDYIVFVDFYGYLKPLLEEMIKEYGVDEIEAFERGKEIEEDFKKEYELQLKKEVLSTQKWRFWENKIDKSMIIIEAIENDINKINSNKRIATAKLTELEREAKE